MHFADVVVVATVAEKTDCSVAAGAAGFVVAGAATKETTYYRRCSMDFHCLRLKRDSGYTILVSSGLSC